MAGRDAMKPIPGLAIMRGTDVNRTGITDAGPPVSCVVLLAWAAASVVSYVIFGVVRPYVLRQEASGIPGRLADSATRTGATVGPAEDKKERETRSWVVRQLFSCVWAWLLVDLTCRLLAYVFLPPTMLWRRKMLPLPQRSIFGYGEWVNKARLILLCGPHRNGTRNKGTLAYFVLGGFFRDVLDLTDNEAAADPSLTEWAARCQQELHWRLPVTGVLHSYASASRETEHEKHRHYSSDAVKASEVEAYHTVVIFAVVVCLAATVSVYHFVVMHIGAFFVEAIDERDAIESTGADSSDTDSNAKARLATEKSEDAAMEQPPGLGQAATDDSWLRSPEALEEEARLRALGRAERKDEQNKKCAQGGGMSTLSVSGMTLTVKECWPTMLGCVYAGMYAYVGGLPILMQFLYPGLILVATVLAMVFAG